MNRHGGFQFRSNTARSQSSDTENVCHHLLSQNPVIARFRCMDRLWLAFARVRQSD